MSNFSDNDPKQDGLKDAFENIRADGESSEGAVLRPGHGRTPQRPQRRRLGPRPRHPDGAGRLLPAGRRRRVGPAPAAQRTAGQRRTAARDRARGTGHRQRNRRPPNRPTAPRPGIACRQRAWLRRASSRANRREAWLRVGAMSFFLRCRRGLSGLPLGWPINAKELPQPNGQERNKACRFCRSRSRTRWGCRGSLASSWNLWRRTS